MNIADAKRLVELEALVLDLTDRAAERREFMGLVRQHGDGALVLAREVVTLRRQLAAAEKERSAAGVLTEDVAGTARVLLETLQRERDEARAALELANDALAAQRETAKRFVAAVHHAGECVLAAVTSYEDDSRG